MGGSPASRSWERMSLSSYQWLPAANPCALPTTEYNRKFCKGLAGRKLRSVVAACVPTSSLGSRDRLVNLFVFSVGVQRTPNPVDYNHSKASPLTCLNKCEIQIQFQK